MVPDASELTELDTQEAWSLLPATGIGRVAGTWRALPHIWPVAYQLAGELITFPAIAELQLAIRSGPTIVGFQVDDATATIEPGWSVVVVGQVDRLPSQDVPMLSPVHANVDLLGLRPGVITGVRRERRADPG